MNLETVRVDFKRPLLIMKAPNGFLACGYINIETCNRTGDACALVNAGNFDDMRTALIVAVSHQAAALGIRIGDTGESALLKMQ
ncbi:DUF1805 domain-containing protein [Rhodocyclus purpureus]|uniref:DUF1805 domain-containing protein n=1 Tax=Rhodocyclus purpureus TaxID=1067 RepID=UPI001911BFF7|nr:DUF1805 domain-containing protein [Rhodocyclus purpureus]MBK5914136.1 hypothetical protein [Rhodocyclus purpureus]